MYDKALNTFINKLTEDAELHNGRIFANINLAATRTGRLSSSNPKWVGRIYGDIYMDFL